MQNQLTDLPHHLELTGRFEACHAFLRDIPGSPVCVECGWLDTEHAAGANVRRLPERAAATRRRLAS